jgi:hypothetical protein
MSQRTATDQTPAAAASKAPPFVLGEHRLVRAADQIDLYLSASNLHAVREGQRYVVRIRTSGVPARMAFTLGPQHVLDHIGGAPSRHILSPPTRLSFLVQPGQDGFELSLEGILGAARGLMLATEPVAGSESAAFSPPSAADFRSSSELVRESVAAYLQPPDPAARSTLSVDVHRLDLALQGIAQADAGAMLMHADVVLGSMAPAILVKAGGSAALVPTPGAAEADDA